MLAGLCPLIMDISTELISSISVKCKVLKSVSSIFSCSYNSDGSLVWHSSAGIGCGVNVSFEQMQIRMQNIPFLMTNVFYPPSAIRNLTTYDPSARSLARQRRAFSLLEQKDFDRLAFDIHHPERHLVNEIPIVHGSVLSCGECSAKFLTELGLRKHISSGKHMSEVHNSHFLFVFFFFDQSYFAFLLSLKNICRQLIASVS